LKSPPSLGSGIPDHLSFVPPGSNEVGFIHLHRTGEDLWYVPGEDHPDHRECPEHPLLVKLGLFNDGVRALFHREQVEDLLHFSLVSRRGSRWGVKSYLHWAHRLARDHRHPSIYEKVKLDHGSKQVYAKDEI